MSTVNDLMILYQDLADSSLDLLGILIDAIMKGIDEEGNVALSAYLSVPDIMEKTLKLKETQGRIIQMESELLDGQTDTNQ